MWYWPFRVITIILFKLLFRLKVEGAENIPTKTNFIVTANHTSYLDPFAIGTAIPKRIYWLALKNLYLSPWTRWFMLGTGTLPVGRSSDIFADLLMDNKIVGLFPEGTRTKDGKLTEFRRGAAMLAFKTGRPIVPCAIKGAHETFGVQARFPRLFANITVVIGRPQFLLKEIDEVIDDLRLQEGTLRLRNSIAEMINAG
jgi:1-acyl-sn-glycerol-3-phosphate acyltransferase